MTVLNKCDRIADAQRVAALELAYQPSAATSATTGQGLEALLSLIEHQLGLLLVEPASLRIPAERSDLVALIYRSGQVVRRQELDGSVELLARIPGTLKALLSAYLLS